MHGDTHIHTHRHTYMYTHTNTYIHTTTSQVTLVAFAFTPGWDDEDERWVSSSSMRSINEYISGMSDLTKASITNSVF